MGDVEALAEVLASAFGLDWRGMPGEPDGHEIAADCAKILLASPWLAAHVAAARAEAWQVGHNAACPMGLVCSAHQPPTTREDDLRPREGA